MTESAAIPDTRDWLTAEEAAARLRVKRETVYAYVSRGHVESRRSDVGRGRVLNPADVERLARRSRGGRRQSASRAESSITLIEDDELYYRGRPVRELAERMSFEEVADLLWGVDRSPGRWEASRTIVDIYARMAEVLPSTALPVDELRLIGACLAAFDPPEPARTPERLVSTAKRFLTTMITALPQRSEPAGPDRIASLLWSRLSPRQASDAELRMLNAAMIMLADHDLAASALAIRAAAGAGLDAGALIRLGMDSGSGVVKGAASLAIEAFLHNLSSADTVGLALTRRLKQGEPIPGFGHDLYASGDARAAHILASLRTAAADRDRLATVEEVIGTQLGRGVPPPNAGFALAAMTYVAGLIPGAGETIFVVSRSAGWIAHAIEALQNGPVERVTSTYVGPPPQRAQR